MINTFEPVIVVTLRATNTCCYCIATIDHFGTQEAAGWKVYLYHPRARPKVALILHITVKPLNTIGTQQFVL